MTAVPKVIEAMALADRQQMPSLCRTAGPPDEPRIMSIPISQALASEDSRTASGISWALTTHRNYDANKLIDLLERDDMPKAKLFEIIAANKDRIDARRLLRQAYELPASEKEQCMRIIHEVADEALLPELITRVDGKDPVIRSYQHPGSRFGGPEVQNALQNQLSDRSKLVRQAALSARAAIAHAGVTSERYAPAAAPMRTSMYRTRRSRSWCG